MARLREVFPLPVNPFMMNLLIDFFLFLSHVNQNKAISGMDNILMIPIPESK